MHEKESDRCEEVSPSFSVNPTIEAGLQDALYTNAYMFAQGELTHVEFLRRMRDLVAISDSIDNIEPFYIHSFNETPKLLHAYQTEADTYEQQGMDAAKRTLEILEPIRPQSPSPREIFVSKALSLTAKTTGIECAKETYIEELASGVPNSEAIISGGIGLCLQAGFPLTTNYFLSDRRLYREEGAESFNRNPVVGASLVIADCAALVGSVAAAYTTNSPEVGVALLAGVKTFFNYAANGIMDHLPRIKK